jgi:prevent-host-death family protein
MTPTKIGVREFRLKIGERLDDVLRGVSFTITRQGRPVAVVISVEVFEEYRRLKQAAGGARETE